MARDAIFQRLTGLHPKVIDLSLSRVLALLEDLGAPHRRLPPVVHVAGTNGKGSLVAYLRAMAEAAGQRVHVYTSPHLVRFNERIRLAGQLIDDDVLTSLLERVEQVNAGRPITFFEITTAAAFLAFAETPADLLLLETGLGGRLDATNVVDHPALTAITPISLDHQQFLGTTVTAIAGEKAGILKPGVTCVLGPQGEDARAVLRARAGALGAPLVEHGWDWSCVAAPDGGMVWHDATQALHLPRPALPGAHQILNAGTAVAVARRLNGIGLEAIGEGLKTVEWPARLQRLVRGPLVDRLGPQGELWLDGGHNPAAGEVLAQHFASLDDDRPLFIIAGMLNTKDAGGFFRPLAEIAVHCHCVTIPGEANAIPAEDLATTARSAGLDVTPIEDAATAIADIARVFPTARVLICGSLYLAGTVLTDNG